MESQRPLAGRDLGFDWPVPDNGYRWWYLDAFSDDGHAALTVIIFVGSVFSPYYFTARQRGVGNPRNFCSINTILYGPRRRHWSMTERGALDLITESEAITIGPSRVEALGETGLRFSIEETCAPIPTKMRGTIDVAFEHPDNECHALDDKGEHRWWPIAPHAQVSVVMEKPDVQWRGAGYLDSNAGVAPLETSFKEWHWQRSALSDEHGEIFYDAESITGDRQSLALRFDAAGRIESHVETAPQQQLSPTPIWRAPRYCRGEDEVSYHVQTLEDSPFYARSKLSVTGREGPHSVMHESLHLNRFKTPWMQLLLPVRMPRRASRMPR